MACLENKIAEIADAGLRQKIVAEVTALKKKTRFGLVFEGHEPEVVPFYARRVKLQDRVARRVGNLAETWKVLAIRDGIAECVKEADETQHERIPVDQLVVVCRVGEPIFPALTPMGSVASGDPQAPHHILIEADNYHALQLLLFPYEGKVDCIYIDPPYNTGARDWKYNNDYVDRNDTWHHSKWLSMMRRRLRLAKRLLNPDTGVLIVTIDEHEVHHLRVLLDEMLPEAAVQMVTAVINPKGVTQGRLSRVEEHIIFCFNRSAKVKGGDDDLLNPPNNASRPRWKGLLRSGDEARRQDRADMFYPVLIDESSGAVIDAGEPLSLQEQPVFGEKRDGFSIAWPVRSDRSLGRWGVGRDTLRKLISKGYVAAGRYDPKRKTFGITYLSQQLQQQIESGELEIVDHDEQRNVVDVVYAESAARKIKTVWHRSGHDAGAYGADILSRVLGRSGAFSFPKSVYAVRDTLACVTRDKKGALVVDFFAGSGTTLHALNLLNANDGGRRRCILITNNEVSEEQARNLMARGLQPGDEGYEALGICRSVTWPRCTFTIRGSRYDGTPIPGDYLTGRMITKEKARAVRQLGFAEGRLLGKNARKQLASVIDGVPQSKIDGEDPWFLNEDAPVSILWDVQQADAWLEALAETEHLTDCLVVTTENRLFNALKPRVLETLGSLTYDEEEKRPLAEGFRANLEYFKLDFLDPAEMQKGQRFAAILPILWMMAGSKGKRPEPPAASAPWLIPPECPFALLIAETRFKDFQRKIETRRDLTHVFIVTNSRDTYYSLREEVDGPQVFQLYKDYLDNFKINLTKE